jgi:antitoxin component of MazEF toxin-antitoxin module
MKTFTTTILDAEDGSGDGILQLPEEFCKEDNWLEGDKISLRVENGSIIMKNISKEERESISR